MRSNHAVIKSSLLAAVSAALVFAAAPASAHCDGLDGPVVKAAQLALDALFDNSTVTI